MIKIYTSYFGAISKISKFDVVPIAICGRSPSWYTGMEYKRLAPKYESFIEYKNTNNWDTYVQHYTDEVLSMLYQIDVVRDLLLRSNNKNPVLLCYEAPESGLHCHRHLVAEWLRVYGYDVEEFNGVNFH
jgi:uncharacterized protein YeaO (DUF488 family)